MSPVARRSAARDDSGGASAERRRDRGSAAAELVFVAPLLMALLGCALLGGRAILARQSIDDAARTAAEAATTVAQVRQASQLASDSVQSALRQQGGLCEHVSTSVDISEFVPGGGVTVRVRCTVRVASLTFPGVPGSITLQAVRGAIIEPYREIGP